MLRRDAFYTEVTNVQYKKYQVIQNKMQYLDEEMALQINPWIPEVTATSFFMSHFAT